MVDLRLVLATAVLFGLSLSCGAHGATDTPAPSESTSGGSHAGTLVQGTVSRRPTCPNEPVSTPCPRVPLAGAEVEIASGVTSVVRTTTDSAGRFAVHVGPGTYRVTVRIPQAVPQSTTTRHFKVGTEPVVLKITVDSGIR